MNLKWSFNLGKIGSRRKLHRWLSCGRETNSWWLKRHHGVSTTKSRFLFTQPQFSWLNSSTASSKSFSLKTTLSPIWRQSKPKSQVSFQRPVSSKLKLQKWQWQKKLFSGKSRTKNNWTTSNSVKRRFLWLRVHLMEFQPPTSILNPRSSVQGKANSPERRDNHSPTSLGTCASTKSWCKSPTTTRRTIFWTLENSNWKCPLTSRTATLPLTGKPWSYTSHTQRETSFLRFQTCWFGRQPAWRR